MKSKVSLRSTRTLLVTIPDHDTAERALRYAAQQMMAGEELLVLSYDPVIPKVKVPGVVAKIVAYLKIQEARYRDLKKAG